MSTEPRIKGFAVRGLLRFVKEFGFPGGIPALLEKLPENAKGHFEEPILSSLWYPYAAFSALARTMDRELGDGRGDLMEEVGRSSGLRDLGGVFRFVTTILTIERVVGRAPALWKRYCDRGELEVVDAAKGHFSVRLTGFPEVAPQHCSMITGWIRGLGEGAGARDAVVQQVKCVHLGDPHCEYSGTWS